MSSRLTQPARAALLLQLLLQIALPQCAVLEGAGTVPTRLGVAAEVMKRPKTRDRRPYFI